jgi:hypothetical protein
MKFKKALLVTGAASTIGLSSMVGVVSAQASTTTTNDSSTKQSLVDKIATKFNLKKDDVQAVFDQDRQEHQQEMQQRLEDRLNKAVTDGKITQQQKTQILDKLKEMKTYIESLKDKTPEERRNLMKAKHDELKKWAQDNNIPLQFIQPLSHVGRGLAGAEQGDNSN